MLKRAKMLVKLKKPYSLRKDSDSDYTDDEHNEDMAGDIENEQPDGEGRGVKRNLAQEDPSWEDMHPNDRPRKTQYLNKQRTLIFASRGLKSRQRHLLKDLRDLLPHSKPEAKFSEKRQLWCINEICEMRGCNNCIFFECRKHYMYMWITRAPYGPSIKFFVENIHTMSELKLTGNCLSGSRPMLVFDAEFDTSEEKRVMKELFIQAFGTPSGHPKSKPFCDHVFSFMWCDGRIWFRNFQIVYDADAYQKSKADPIMVEIGPRFCMCPVRILSSSFKGQTLWQNLKFATPTDKSVARKAAQGRKLALRMKQAQEKKERLKQMEENKLYDPTENVFATAPDVDDELEVSSSSELD